VLAYDLIFIQLFISLTSISPYFTFLDYLHQIYKSLLIHTYISYHNLQNCANFNNNNQYQNNKINYECDINYLFNINNHITKDISNIISKDSYNLILTSNYMMLIPRSKKAFHFNDNNNDNIKNSYFHQQHHQHITIEEDHINNNDNDEVLEINSLGFLGLFLIKQSQHIHYLQKLSLFDDILQNVSRNITYN